MDQQDSHAAKHQFVDEMASVQMLVITIWGAALFRLLTDLVVHFNSKFPLILALTWEMLLFLVALCFWTLFTKSAARLIRRMVLMYVSYVLAMASAYLGWPHSTLSDSCIVLGSFIVAVGVYQRERRGRRG